MKLMTWNDIDTRSVSCTENRRWYWQRLKNNGENVRWWWWLITRQSSATTALQWSWGRSCNRAGDVAKICRNMLYCYMFATCSNLATGEAKISGPHNMHRWQSCHALISYILTFSPWIWAFKSEPNHLTRIHPCLPNMISQRSGLATATSLATPLTCCWPGWTEATATRRTLTASSPWSRCSKDELKIKSDGERPSLQFSTSVIFCKH